MEAEEGQSVERERGTPQGGVVSPLLANLFLHYAFDMWVTSAICAAFDFVATLTMELSTARA